MASKIPSHRPFTPRQQRENARFLAALRRTGNVRLTCRDLGLHRACYTKRRARCAAFAAAWDAALAEAHAAFAAAGGERLPEQGTVTRHCPLSSLRTKGPVLSEPGGLRTKGGEPVVTRQANGRLQLRRAPPGRMTAAAERRILATVGETNNIRLAAAEAGFAHSTILARARHDPALARNLALAQRIGQDRVMWAWMHPPGRPDPADHDFALLPMPPTSVDQALLQLVFHKPDGPFQRYRWRVRPLPKGIACYAPGIRAKISAMKRADWHAETGSWVYPEESEAAGEQ